MSTDQPTNKLEINTPGTAAIDGDRWVMFVPDKSLGHDEVEWTPDDKPSQERAKKLFEDKLAAGWQAFKEMTRADGVKYWEKLEKFDAKISKILLLPISKKLAVGG